MYDRRRADIYAELLNKAGKQWRHAIPVDAEIARLTGDGSPRVRISGHVLARDVLGRWSVAANQLNGLDEHCERGLTMFGHHAEKQNCDFQDVDTAQQIARDGRSGTLELERAAQILDGEVDRLGTELDAVRVRVAELEKAVHAYAASLRPNYWGNAELERLRALDAAPAAATTSGEA